MKLPSGRVIASAPGKIILAGEHFVVHGSYAVAAAIDRRVRVSISKTPGHESEIVSNKHRSLVFSDDNRFSAVKSVLRSAIDQYGKPRWNFKVEIHSEIPPNSGLGSSAATSVATSAAIASFLGKNLSTDDVLKLAAQGERSVHGNPSGIDTEASLLGGIFLFSKKSGAKPIPINRALQFLVVFSGKARSTLDLISKVNQTRERFPASFDNLLQTASFLSLEVADAVSDGDLPYLGSLMNLAQLSLSWIGVSTGDLDELIEMILVGDVFGAKITGAGGGGSVIALPKPEKAESLLQQILARYKSSFITSIPQEGLRWEN